MNFFKDLVSSVYGPAQYTALSGRSLKSLGSYFLKWVVLLSLIFASVLAMKSYPLMKSFFAQGIDQVRENYPAGLVVTIKDGVVSTNADEPTIIPLTVEGEGQPFNLFVIDTQNEFSLERFQNYKTLMLLSQNSFVYTEDNDKVSIQPLTDNINLVITGEKLESWLARLQPLIKVIPVMIFVAMSVFMTVFKFVGSLVYLLIATLALWLLSKLLKLDFTYKETYKRALYAYSLPLLLTYLVYLNLVPDITFLPSLLLIIIFFTNVWPVKSVSV